MQNDRSPIRDLDRRWVAAKKYLDVAPGHGWWRPDGNNSLKEKCRTWWVCHFMWIYIYMIYNIYTYMMICFNMQFSLILGVMLKIAVLISRRHPKSSCIGTTKKSSANTACTTGPPNDFQSLSLPYFGWWFAAATLKICWAGSVLRNWFVAPL